MTFILRICYAPCRDGTDTEGGDDACFSLDLSLSGFRASPHLIKEQLRAKAARAESRELRATPIVSCQVRTRAELKTS